MTSFLAYTIVGISTGCIYALTASGLVVTYTTSGIFNFAHGAIGMVMAFAYWELSVKNGWPQPLALLVVLGVLAPLTGALIERVLMRRLHGASTGMTLVVTLGLLLSLLGLATTRWDPTEPRTVPEFFDGRTVKLFTVVVTYHQLTTVLVAVLVAAFLRLLFYRTRIGVAMRAVVDDPDLAALNGVNPGRVAQFSWALGAVLAGTAGILLAPLVSLDIIILTLLVVNGYAAAMVGRLKSLPWTFAGALALGLMRSHVIGQLGSEWVSRVEPALPIIFLYVVLLVLPQTRLKAGRLVSARLPRVPGLRESLIAGAGFVFVVAVFSRMASGNMVGVLSRGIALSLVMLSLVLLVGYAGQVSLAQMTFVGLGAVMMGKFFGGDSPLGLLLAIVVPGAVGALAALPALRLQGLYLALSTLAFARAMSTLFFNDQRIFGYGGRLSIGRPEFFGLSFESNRAYVVLLAVVFAAAGIGLLALRRGPFGRRLLAMKDSEAACATLGLGLTWTKLAVFTLSASMAGLAGTFYGGVRGQVGSFDVEMLQSLALLLLVYVSGINTVIGALMGGLSFALFPEVQKHFPDIRQLQYLGAGIGAMMLSRTPNGWTAELSGWGDKLRGVVDRSRSPESRKEVGDLVGAAH